CDSAQKALDELLGMQRQAIAGTLLKHAIGYGKRALPDPQRLLVAAQSDEPIHEPAAGLGIIGTYLGIVEILAAQLGGDLQRLLLVAPGSLEVVGLQILEAGTSQGLQVSPPGDEGGVRIVGERLENGLGMPASCGRARVLLTTEEEAAGRIARAECHERRFRLVTAATQAFEQPDGFVGIADSHAVASQISNRLGMIDQRQGAATNGIGTAQLRRQRVEVVDLALGELRQHLETSEAFQLSHESVGQISQQLLGVGACLLGDRPAVLRHALGSLRPSGADVTEYRSGDRQYREQNATGGNGARPPESALGRLFSRTLVYECALGCLLRFTRFTLIPPRLHDEVEYVVSKHDATHVESLLDAQQSAIDERCDCVGCGP